jgi:hypothetical protein
METDVNKLYSQDTVSIKEAMYLLGDIPNQNVYDKLLRGRIEFVLTPKKDGREVKRIKTKSLYNYILRQKGELYRRADRYRLPTITLDNLKD